MDPAPTDYSRIADRYDANPIRHLIPKDEGIETLYQERGNRLTVLDLACGTGNYLRAQAEHYRGYAIRWLGADLSEAMLDRARAKNLGAELVLADAAHLPYPDASVDAVVIRFAHHHFTDKAAVFAEVHRVLAPGGRLTLFNIAPDRQLRSWVHHYFPGTRAVDEAKFLPALGLYALLSASGFRGTLEVTVQIREVPTADLGAEARNRDMSQLNSISEAEYLEGLGRLEADAARGTTFTGDLALLDYRGFRK